jgi:putative glutamine transport system substrate-binding protein
MMSLNSKAQRNLIALFLCVALAFASSSCNAVQQYVNLDALSRVVSTPVPVEIELTPTVTPADISTAALVKLRSRIRVGVRFDAPPLTRVNDGELEGFDIDLAREFARRWLGSERNVEFIQVTSSSAPQKVKNREVDFAMGGLTRTRAVENDTDFSIPYLQDGEALLIRTNTFADFAQMSGKSIVYIDDASTFILRDAQNASGITVTTKSAGSYAEAYNALLQQEADGMIGRWRRLRTRAAQDPTLNVLTVFRQDTVAIMLPQNDSEWNDFVNFTLSNMILDGFYAQAYQKWFGAPSAPASVRPLSNPLDLQLAQLSDSIVRQDVLSKTLTSNALRVGFALSEPTLKLNEGGLPDGLEADVCRELALRIFNNSDAAQFQSLASNALPSALQSGQIDIAIAGFRFTQQNERVMDVSIPIHRDNAGDIVVGVAQNQSAWRDLVNRNLQAMQADGALDAIRQKWFSDTVPMEVQIWR